MHAIQDAALLPWLAPIWGSDWAGVLPISIIADDVCHWPYSVGVLATLVAFLGWRGLKTYVTRMSPTSGSAALTRARAAS